MFPILPAFCTCGIPIGMYQREIESSIGIKMETLKKNNPTLTYCQILSKARIETFNKIEPFENISKFDEQMSNFTDDELLNLSIYIELGFTRDCCLLSLTTYPFLTFNDIEGQDAFVDFTKNPFINKKDEDEDENFNLQISENSYVPNVINDYVGAEFYPFTNGVLGFDKNLYCAHLYEITLRTSTRYIPLENLVHSPTVPQFANLYATRDPYPLLLPGRKTNHV